MATEDDFSSLPLPERIVHKQWKVRVAAYENLADIYKNSNENSQEYTNYLNLLKKIANDPNLPAQEAGLGTFQAFLEKAPTEVSIKTRNLIVPIIAEKHLSSSRTGIRIKAMEVIMLYMEIDVPDPVIELLLPIINHKTPKVVASIISAIKEGLQCYGSKNVNIKPLLKIFTKIFGHSDKKVRDEAFSLAVEIYEWIGQSIESFLEPLKPVQVKELHELFSKAQNVGSKTQKRLLRKQKEIEQQEMDIDEEDENAMEEDNIDIEPTDSYDLIDPVNVLNKIPKGFYDKIKSTKWKERKEILEELLTVLNPPKYEEGKYGELLTSLAKHVGDPNVLCCILSANCIEKIAKAIKNSFSTYRSIVVGPLLDRLKEKKQNVVDALSNALDAVYLSSTIADISEIVIEKMKSKNPLLKSETIKWVIRCLKTGKGGPQREQIKIISEALLKDINDSSNIVRESAAECFATLMKCVGERAMAQYIEQVDKSREAKIKEYYEKVEIKSLKPKIVAKQKKPMSTPRDIQNKENSPPSGKQTLNINQKSMKKKKSPLSGMTNQQKANDMIVDQVMVESNEGFNITEEQAIEKANEMFGEEMISNLKATVWKARLNAIDSLLSELKQKDPNEINANIITKLLSIKPGWKENNFQVNAKLYTVLKFISTLPSFNEQVAEQSVPYITEKLGDLKIKKVAGECLEAYIEALGFQTVLKYMYNTIKNTNSPKTISDSFLWINSNILDFGIEGIDVFELIQILKIGFNHSAPACRNNAVAVISTLRMYCGPDIRNYIEDINPTLLSNIDKEFEKVATRNPPKPSRIQGVSMNIQENKTEKPKKPEVTYKDISQQLNEKLINNLGSSNWRLRKEAMEDVVNIINEANQKILPNIGDLPQALIPRFNDTNKNLVCKAIDLYSLLAISIGPPFMEYAKVMLSSLLPTLGDNKTQIRISANNALNSTLSVMSFETLLTVLSEIMTADQPLFRKEIAKWLNEKLGEIANNNKKMPDLNIILNPIILYLMDKNNEVRHEAHGCFTYIANSLSIDTIKNAYTNIRGAANFVTPILESIHPGSTVVKSPPKQVNQNVKEIPGLSKARLAGSNKKRIQTTQSIGTKKDLAIDNSAQPPIITLDNRAKEIRAEKDKGLLKWSFDNPKQELNDLLSEQSENHFNNEIHTLLFSKSHYKEKDHLQALNILFLCLSDHQYTYQKYSITWEENCQRFISVTDLILKYLTLRFCDTNTTILIKCLDLLDSLFAMLDENGYYLSEYEASCFLPSFINKVGDNKDIIRQRIRILMKQLCRIYPASRSFIYISEGLKSKNSRTRAECLEELGCLIQRNGLTVCHQSKAFPIIANQISDRDASVRNAAINTIIEAYKQIGNNVFKYLGRISERDRGLIDEKLKRLPPTSTFQNKALLNENINQNIQINNNIIENKKNISEVFPQSPTPMEIDTPMSTGITTNNNIMEKSYEQANVKKEFSLEIDKLNLPQLSNPINYSMNFNNNDRLAKMSMNNEKSINQMKNIESPIQMAQMNNNMMNNTMYNKNSMSMNENNNDNNFGFNSGRRSMIDFSTSGPQKDYMMDFITTQIMSGVSSESVDALKQLDPLLKNHPEFVIPHINQTINAITFQMKLVFNSENINSPNLVRLCKHLINVLVLIFSNIELSRSISKDSLYPLFEEVLKGMLDNNLTKSEAGSQLVRALNILMVRILDNSNRNISFSALLLLLEKSSAILVSISNSNDNEKITIRAKFTELVMKCLWKMTKALQKMLETNTLQVNQLLLDINNLFIATPPSEWKKRASENFPIGDMPLRTVKTILSELTSSLGDKIFENFDLINDPQRSYVYSYISHMVQSQKKRNALNSSNQNYSNSSSTNSSPTNIQQQFNPVQQNQQIQQQSQENQVNQYNNLQNNNINTNDEIDNKLDYLFSKMQRGDQIKPTIKEIYQILQTYPESKSKIDERIENSSSLIRTLVRRGLATLSDTSSSSIPSYSYQSEYNQRHSMISNKSTDDTTETYKQKLLRLQQMFGYKNENMSNNNSSSNISSQKISSSSISSASSSSQMNTPYSNISSLQLRNNLGYHKYESSSSSTSTSVTVAGLKERLERMKQSMNNQHILNQNK